MLVIGSRGSELALAQARWIQGRMEQLFPSLETSIRIIKTSGDTDTTSSIRAGASIGVFVKEIERSLLDNEIDLAVHSMKDLPTAMQPELTIAAIPEREDPRDALISGDGSLFSEMRPGSRIGTGSLRRQAQLRALRPDIEVMDIRGNVNTRLRKLDEKSCDAVVLACAGLNRLNFHHRITEKFTLDQVLPAPGQGALAVQCRTNDPTTLSMASALNDPGTSVAVRSERTFLERIGGGCNIPAAAYASMENGQMRITGLIIHPGGGTVIKRTLEGRTEDASQTARTLADLILGSGGRSILDALKTDGIG
jgi:hydroxymethylbilane synthase